MFSVGSWLCSLAFDMKPSFDHYFTNSAPPPVPATFSITTQAPLVDGRNVYMMFN